MNSIDKTVRFMNGIYSEYSDKSLLMKKEYASIKYSRVDEYTFDQCLSMLFKVHNYKLPKLCINNKYPEKNHTEYFFDKNNELISKKDYFNSSGRLVYDYFYVRTSENKIRLKFKNNILENIHCCKFENDILCEIVNARFGTFGELEELSGEIYKYDSLRLSKCVNYQN